MSTKLASILTGLIFVFTLSFCHQKNTTSKEVSIYLNHNDTVAYTGIESCRSCHADKFETFRKTGMGMSFDSASIEKSSADFKNAIAVYDTFQDLYYFPFLNNGNFYLKEFRLHNHDTVYSRTEKINYIIGSGHHTNSHMIMENGYVFQAPITFYTQKGKWDLPPGFERGNNTRFSRKIGLECMSCHNALPTIDRQSDNRFISLPHGISCERCHGPGEKHIQEKMKGNIVDVKSQIDYSIVNPRKLSWQRQIDICQRCHLQGNAVLKPGKEFTDFKPGMVLSETFDQFSPEYEDGEDFVMAAHAERFQMSKCFLSNLKGNINSSTVKPGFTCISCHDPHVSVRQTNSIKFNQTCQTCHQKTKTFECTIDLVMMQKSKFDCVSCHMPSSGTSDIPHVSVHDHYIRKPLAIKGKKPSILKGLRCITSQKTDVNSQVEAYISYYEKFDQNKFYIAKAVEKGKSLNANNIFHLKTLIHLYYITEDYKSIIELKFNPNSMNDAWTFYRIAKAYEHENFPSRAEVYYLKALEYQASNLDFILQYAVSEIKSAQWKKAEIELQKYNSLYSKSAESWAWLGVVKMKLNDLVLAKQHFMRSLQLDPDQMIALQNIKTLYALLGDKTNLSLIEKRIQTLQPRKIK